MDSFNQTFVNKCMIVCSDLDEVLSKFKSSNLSLNGGAQSKRD